MSNEEKTVKKTYFQQQNIEISFDRIILKGLSGMAQGLFASLLIGTIIKTIGGFIPGAVGEFLVGVAGYTGAVQGAAMALAIGYAMQCPPYVLFSLATVGYAANALGGGGGPLAVYLICLVAIFAGKLVSKRTPIDLLVTPTVTILVGVLLATWFAPTIGKVATILGQLVMWATDQQPFLMGILVSVIMGIVLTLPISSAAICAALGLVGLAGGAAVAGCCAQMVGFAVISFRENRWSGLVAQGLGTSMLQMGNICRRPAIWLPPTLAAAVCGPLATMLFKLECTGVSAGMGTCGLVGPLGILSAMPEGGAMMWIGILVDCILLPAVLSFLFNELFRKIGWIHDGDMKLEL